MTNRSGNNRNHGAKKGRSKPRSSRVSEVGANVAIVNQSGLPDGMIREAVAHRWMDITESAAFSPGGFGSRSPLQTTPRSLFVRGDYRPPTNPIEEMELAIRLYEEDDDVANAIDMMVALMFQGMKNLHEDEDTVFKFNAMAEQANLDMRLRELATGIYKTGQVYPVKLFSRQRIPNFKPGANPSAVLPNMVFLNPLSVRVVEIDGLGEPVLVQEVDEQTHNFLLAIGKGNERPTAAQQVKRSDNPIAAALYTEQFVPDRAKHGEDDLLMGGARMWYLNPKMVKRYALTNDVMNTTNQKYAPLLMKRVFGLCEAKRLLNVMDYTLLQGGINFLIVVRKGSDQIPAQQLEIDNLTGIVQRAARTGVIVGDHRLDVDIIMPKMDTLLSKEKRNALGESIAQSLLRLPKMEFGRVEGGGTPQAEIVSQVLMSDRLILRRHIERDLYAETVARNGSEFKKGAPKLWFPPVMVSGSKFFTDYVLKLRDRGDISRTTAVEAAGLDAGAELAQRRREKANGFDSEMTAENVPSTGANPANTGRPTRADGGGSGDTDPVDDANRDTSGGGGQ